MTATVAQMTTGELREMIEVHAVTKEMKNFKKSKELKPKVIEVNRLENEGDAVLRQGIAKLFREEPDALTVMKWKEIYENLEQATDRCEDVANIIEGVVLENS